MSYFIRNLVILVACVMVGIACSSDVDDETIADEGIGAEDNVQDPSFKSREDSENSNSGSTAPDEGDPDEENLDEEDLAEDEPSEEPETGDCSPEGATEQCYAGPLSTRGVGICQSGTQTCEDGVWGPCEGMVTQEKETCDGRDEDCDGETDEDLSLGSCDLDDVTEEELETHCLATELLCENGSFICKLARTPVAEECNGKDDDCDGDTDEDLDTICYEGSSGCHVNDDGEWECQGICRTGEQRCIDGELSEQCDGEVTPRPSEECYAFPALDDDCDGDIDEGCESFDVRLIEGDPDLCGFNAIATGPQLTLVFDAAFVETQSESSDIDEDASLGCIIEVGFTMLRYDDDSYYTGLRSSIDSGFVVTHEGTATFDAHIDINGQPAHEVVQTWNSPAMETIWTSDNEASLAPVFSKSAQCSDGLQTLSGTIAIRFDLSSHWGDSILGIDIIDILFTEDWCDGDPSRAVRTCINDHCTAEMDNCRASRDETPGDATKTCLSTYDCVVRTCQDYFNHETCVEECMRESVGICLTAKCPDTDDDPECHQFCEDPIQNEFEKVASCSHENGCT